MKDFPIPSFLAKQSLFFPLWNKIEDTKHLPKQNNNNKKQGKKGEFAQTVRVNKDMSIKANIPPRKFTGKDRACYIQNSKEADMNFKKPSRKDQSVNRS